VSVLLYEQGLRALLDLPGGPVARNVTERAEAVAERARQNVRATFRTRSGNLEGSIDKFPRDEIDGGLSYEVGTDGAPYGRVLELGAQAHVILPTTQRVLVSLPSNPDPLRAPRFIVNHPGSPPRPWLMPALESEFLGG
jgi:hypothetical protein